MSADYQVIVAGGGMAGVAAAAAAGRNGAKTLLIESSAACGGMGSNGLVPSFTPFSYKGLNNPVIGGIASEMLKNLQAIRGSNHDAWPFLDAEAVKFVCDRMLEEANAETAYLTNIIDVKVQDRIIQTITVHDRSGIHVLSADNFIDATGDAFLAYSAGVPTLSGDAKNRTQPGSCCMVIAGVDSKNFPEPDKAAVDGVCGVTGLLRRYTAEFLNKGLLNNAGNFEYHIAGANLDVAGGILRINFGHFYDLGSCDAKKISKLLQDGRKYTRIFADCLKNNMPGMQNTVLISTPALPDIRESRRIVGRTTLTDQAYWQGERHDDDIAVYDYMIDVHALDISEQTAPGNGDLYNRLLKNSMEKCYGIPFSIMLPQAIDNLAVAGRCVSAEQPMLGSLRVMPAVMAMGQAVGTAAAICKPLSEVNIKKLQQKLLADNVVLTYPN